MSLVRRMDRAVAAGVAPLGADFIAAVRSGVLAHRCPDGGFRGRAGGSDAWYTAFALRCLELTGGIPEAIAARADAWSATLPPPTGPRSALDHATIAVLLGRSPAIPAGAAPTACYDAFAFAVHADLAGLPVPACDLAACRREGGFAETATHPQPQVPATAAALVALRLAGTLPAEDRRRALVGLRAAQGADGGLRVHADAPAGDLLSTATGVWALAACGALGHLDLAAAARFAIACRRADGFGACPGDDAGDPEYAWYGLTLLGLLRRFSAPGPAGWLRRRGWLPP